MSESTASQPAADKSSDTQTLEEFASREYEWGFVTDIEADSAPPGLNERDHPVYIGQKKRNQSLCSSGASRPTGSG